MRPYDLTASACGSTGASIAAANGRYVWISSADHPGGNYDWSGGSGFRLGFSNDPGVLPSSMTLFYPEWSVNPTVTIATITASIGPASNVLHVTAVTGGITNDGHAKVSGAGVITATITSQSSGTQLGTGDYVIDGSPQTVGSETMTVTQTNYNLYQNPFLVCNPDDASFPFYVYAEGAASAVQHEEGLIKSADLVTWTSEVPTHVTPVFDAWSSYQRPVRDGVNSWHSTGFEVNYLATGNIFGRSKWTSTDGKIWTPGSTAFNSCVPSSSSSPAGSADKCTNGLLYGPEAAPDSITLGAQAWGIGKIDTYVSSVRNGSQWVGRVPIDASFNVLNSPSPVNVSAAYAGSYPGPTYLQAGFGYVEDGIAHYYGLVGFLNSSSVLGLVDAATYANGGGLWQEGIDYYTEIIDATAAVNAAPVGVKASCDTSTVTLSWFDALPNRTYRVYRGTTAGTQATLIGDVTGTTITDTPTGGSVYYYKVVTLNAGVEKQSRIVSTYASSSVALVNAHMTRVLAAGADPTTINRTWLDTFASWLSSNGLTNDLLFATMADFGVIQNGSHVISKVMDLGTTRLPRGGDYTPLTTGVTYSATAINGFPAWVDAAGTDSGYYGGDRTNLNNLRRLTQITVFSAYQKPNTNAISPLVIGQFTGRMILTHTSGSPGAINFLLSDATQQKTATASISGLATDFHTAAGVFDGANLIAYSDAVAGSSKTGLVIPSPNLNPPDMLTGQVGIVGNPANVNVLLAGTDQGLYNTGTGYVPGANQAQYSGGALIVFDKGLTPTQITLLNTLIRTHFGL